MWLTWSVLVLGILGTIAAATWMAMRLVYSYCRPPVSVPIVLAAVSTVAVSVSWPAVSTMAV